MTKEREFKVGDEISNNDINFWGDTKFTIREIMGDLIKCIDDSSFPGFHWFNKKQCFHTQKIMNITPVGLMKISVILKSVQFDLGGGTK